MSSKEELVDIREEWAFVQKNSGPGHAIAVHGGWLVGAMTQMFDYINDLEVAAKARNEESLALIEQVATHEEEARQMRDTLEEHQARIIGLEADIDGMVAELHPAP